MNSKVVKGILLALLLAAFYLLYKYSGGEVTKSYEMSKRNIKNPGKGYYVQLSSEKSDQIAAYIGHADLFFLEYDIYQYKDRALDEGKLKELELFLNEIRKHHSRCIFRAAYGFDRYEVNDAERLEIIEKHIAQIAPILNENKDLILAVQAGFFGPWGEWHSSIYLEQAGEAAARRNKLWLIRKLLEELDESITVNLRRPGDIQAACKAGCDMRRLGFHNDGLLASATDLGTYQNGKDRERALSWLSEHIITGYNGGEIPYVSNYAVPANVLEEFPKMKLSYLNMKYNEEVYDLWKQKGLAGENAYHYISRHLGYVLYISEIKFPRRLKSSGALPDRGRIEIEITNGGFAPIAQEYAPEWVIQYRDGSELTVTMEAALSLLAYQEKLRVQLPLSPYSRKEIQRIGIRIRSKNSKAQIELANDEFRFSEGINYIWEAGQGF